MKNRRLIFRLESAGDVLAFTRCARCGKAIALLAHVQEWSHVVTPTDSHSPVLPRFVPDMPEELRHSLNYWASHASCHCGAKAEIAGMCSPCKYAAHENCWCSQPSNVPSSSSRGMGGDL